MSSEASATGPFAKRNFIEWLLAVGIGLALLGWFFRFSIASRFDAIPGNTGDARFIIFVCEHWLQVFSGKAQWLSPPMFFPVGNTLGWAESLFLFGAPYSILRTFGLDSYSSFQMLVFFFIFMGYFFTFILLRRFIHLGRWASIFGASLFAYSSAMYNSIDHAQLETAALVPLLAMTMARYLRNIATRDNAGLVAGLASAAIFALMAYSSFYVAWFTLLFTIFAALLSLLGMVVIRGREKVRRWRTCIASHWPSVASVLLATFLFSGPFILTYAPTFKLTLRRSYEDVSPLLPRVIDLINVGFDNNLWGSALRAIAPDLQSRPAYWELDKGISPIALAAFVLASAWALMIIMNARCASGPKPYAALNTRLSVAQSSSAVAVVIMACAGAVYVSWLLMITIDDRSLWLAVYTLFPGATAVRAVYRFNIVLMLPIATVVAWGMDLRLGNIKPKKTWRRIIPVLVAVIMLAEQSSSYRNVFSKSAQQEFMREVPVAPQYCHSMAITTNIDRYQGAVAPLQIDAMLIAQAHSIPTVNGYSGRSPEHWVLDHPLARDYFNNVVAWGERNNIIDGLCAYQVESRSWSLFSQTAPSVQ